MPHRQELISAEDENMIVDTIKIWKRSAWKAWKSTDDKTEEQKKKRCVHAIILLDQMNCMLALGKLEIKMGSYTLFSKNMNEFSPPKIFFNKDKLTVRSLVHEFLHYYDAKLHDKEVVVNSKREKEIRDEALRISILSSV